MGILGYRGLSNLVIEGLIHSDYALIHSDWYSDW